MESAEAPCQIGPDTDPQAACGKGEICAISDADTCRGTCRPADEQAFCPEIYQPVCGCGQTEYSNSCFANMDGNVVKHEGKCVQTPIQPTIITLTASYDTFVDSSQAEVNYGSFSRLRVDGSPRSWVYVAFDMAPVQAAQITKAALRLYSVGDGGGGLLYSLPNAVAWDESEPTWLNVDGLISRVDEEYIQTIGAIDQENEWYEFDVTDSIIAGSTSGSEIRTFLVKGRNSNGLSYASRERDDGELAPQLVITYNESGSILGLGSPNDTNEPSRRPTRPPLGWVLPKRPPTRRVSLLSFWI